MNPIWRTFRTTIAPIFSIANQVAASGCKYRKPVCNQYCRCLGYGETAAIASLELTPAPMSATGSQDKSPDCKKSSYACDIASDPYDRACLKTTL